MAAEGVVGAESTVIFFIVKRADAFKHSPLKGNHPRTRRVAKSVANLVDHNGCKQLPRR